MKMFMKAKTRKKKAGKNVGLQYTDFSFSGYMAACVVGDVASTDLWFDCTKDQVGL